MRKWFRNKMMGLMLALSKTEANIKSNDDDLILSTGKFQSNKQGMLSHSLVNGELTEEVKELRWRIYKIVKHTQGVRSEIVGYDENDNPIVVTHKTKSRPIKGFKSCPVDNYNVLMVVTNKTMDMGTTDSMNKINQETDDISFSDYLTQFKGAKSIFIKREFRPMFEIEQYTTRMAVKEINEDAFLLEFYVNKYPNQEDRRSRLFLSEIKKIIEGKHNSSVVDFDTVLFISDKTMGTMDFMEYEFEVDKFDKITEFDGYYVIKFIATATVFGDDVLDKYKIDGLETKYENKEKK